MLAVASMIPFLKSVKYGLINLDDYPYLTFHPQLWQGPWLESLQHFFTDVSEGIWMPLTWLSYAADFALFDQWWGGFHLHSIVLHAANTVLVWLVIRSVLGSESRKDWPCLLGALVWAVHPLRCESVVFLASRKDVLSFFFELLAILVWVRGSRSQAVARRSVLTIFSILLFVLGSFCKPSVMTFPLLVLIIDLFVIRRVHILRYVPVLAYALFLGLFAGWQQNSAGAMSAGAGDTVLMRLVSASAAFGIYLWHTVCPTGLAVQCIRKWPNWPRFAVPGLVISATYAALLLNRFRFYWQRRSTLVKVGRLDDLPVTLEVHAEPAPVFVGLAWFAIAVAPMLGVAGFGYHAFADRFTYIPAVGLSLALSSVLLKFSTASTWGRIIPHGASLVIVSLALLTWRQTGFWENDFTLFSHTLEVDGDDNWFAHNNLGHWYFEFPHDLEKCAAEYEKVWKNDKKYMVQTFELYVFALCELGRTEGVAEMLRDYWKYIEETRPSEDMANVFAGFGTRSANFAKNVYLASRTALLISDPKTVEIAGQQLANLTDDGADDPAWQYLRMRYELQRGNNEAAEKARKELVCPRRIPGYHRFRYLSKESDHGLESVDRQQARK